LNSYIYKKYFLKIKKYYFNINFFKNSYSNLNNPSRIHAAWSRYHILLNRSGELSKETYLDGLEKSSTVTDMQAKNVRTPNDSDVNERKAINNN